MAKQYLRKSSGWKSQVGLVLSSIRWLWPSFGPINDAWGHSQYKETHETLGIVYLLKLKNVSSLKFYNVTQEKPNSNQSQFCGFCGIFIHLFTKFVFIHAFPRPPTRAESSDCAACGLPALNCGTASLFMIILKNAIDHKGKKNDDQNCITRRTTTNFGSGSELGGLAWDPQLCSYKSEMHTQEALQNHFTRVLLQGSLSTK